LTIHASGVVARRSSLEVEECPSQPFQLGNGFDLRKGDEFVLSQNFNLERKLGELNVLTAITRCAIGGSYEQLDGGQRARNTSEYGHYRWRHIF
jgi:hypothetical protein